MKKADKTDHLFISDIFRSVQGEGSKAGTPSVFLRLGMCNLHCTWCDTPYTWKPGMTDYKQMTFSQIIQKIGTLRKNRDIRNLVITGGEPLLQQKKLAELLKHAKFADMEIEFETNGSQPATPELLAFNPAFNISPKLADSGNKPYKVHFYPNSVLKFVYVSKKSETLIDAFLQKHSAETKDIPVLIMPEGTSAEQMEKKTKNVLEYCARHGFRFTPRLHIYLFGNKRAT